MIETLNDFMSVFVLLNIIFVLLYAVFHAIGLTRKRKIIEKELEYYRIRD